MVAEPQDYPWSSCRHRFAEAECDWLDHDPCYLALGKNDAERRMRYRAFLQAAIPDGEWSLIRESVQRGQLTGTDRFTEEVAAITGRRIERRGQGRPMVSVNKK